MSLLHRPVPILALALASSLAIAAPDPLDTADVGGVVVGDAFLDDWTVTEQQAYAGGLRLVLTNGDQQVDVDVVRRGTDTLAPVYSDRLELYVMDGHDGEAAIDPDLSDALHVLLEQLGDVRAQRRLASRLLTHEQRFERFPKLMRRAHRR